MKIQPIHLTSKVPKQNIRKQVYDALSVYKYIGLPVIGFIGTDIFTKRIKQKSNFYDKISL